MTRDNSSNPDNQIPNLQPKLKEVVKASKKIQEVRPCLNMGPLAAHLKAITQVQARIQESLQPFAQFQENLNRTFASAGPIAAQIVAITQVQARIQESLQPFSQFHESLIRTIISTGPIAAHLRELTPLGISVDFEKILPIVRKAIDETSESQIEISPQGEVVANGITIPIEEVRSRTDELLRNSQPFSDLLTGQGSLESNVKDILSEIKKQNSPLRLFFLQVLVTVLSTLLINLTSPLFQDLLNRKLVKKKQTIEIVQREAKSLGLKPEHLRNLGLVRATALMVRKAPYKRSNSLGKLYNGQLVRIIQKRRNWSLIEFFKDEQTFRGWVFSRYLQRLDTNISKSPER